MMGERLTRTNQEIRRNKRREGLHIPKGVREPLMRCLLTCKRVVSRDYAPQWAPWEPRVHRSKWPYPLHTWILPEILTKRLRGRDRNYPNMSRVAHKNIIHVDLQLSVAG